MEAPGLHIIDLVSDLYKSSASIVRMSSEISVHRSSRWLIFSRPTPPFQTALSVPGCTKISSLDAIVHTKVRPVEDVRACLRDLGPYRACFDLDMLQHNLLLRNWKQADRFRPYGLSGTKKISDLFINHKIPKPLRDEVPLLLSGNVILWVIGLRTAQPAAVTCRTTRVLDMVFNGGWGNTLTVP